MILECVLCGDDVPSGPDGFEDRIDHALEQHGVEDLDEYRGLYRPTADRGASA